MTVTLTNRSRVLLTLALFLALCASVQAALEAREEAHELQSKQILRWPLRAGDSLVIKPCADCDVQTLQVTENTRYEIGLGRASKAITLNELLRQKSLLRDKENHLIVIFFQPNDQRVTRVVLQTEF